MKYHGGQAGSWSPGSQSPYLFLTLSTMYRAFTGALALALALLVLHWFLPELAQELFEVILKILKLISAVLDSIIENMQAH